MNRTKVLVVDHHPVLRKLLVDIRSSQERFAVVGEASDGREVIYKAKESQPDVIIMDLQLPKIGGIRATWVLQREVPRANVVIYTFSTKENHLYAAMEAGARGYILKNSNSTELLRAVLEVSHGKVFVSPELDHIVMPDAPLKEPILEGNEVARRQSQGRWVGIPT